MVRFHQNLRQVELRRVLGRRPRGMDRTYPHADVQRTLSFTGIRVANLGYKKLEDLRSTALARMAGTVCAIYRLAAT